MSTFSTTPPDPAALRTLLQEANQSPFIGHIRAAELRHLMAAGRIRFLYTEDGLAGFGAWLPITHAWDEIGPLYVSERYRGQGFGRLVLEDIIAACEPHHTHLYAVTRNPAVKHLFDTLGFEAVGWGRLPWRVQRFVLAKLDPLKVLRFLQKPHPEPMGHYLRRFGSASRP